MTLEALVAYFEKYAQENTDLQHVPGDPEKQAFIAVNTTNDIDTIIRSCAMDTIMVLLPYDKKLIPAKGESYLWEKHTCFLIIRRCPDLVAAEIISAQSLCESIADEFIKQIIIDRTTLLTDVELSSIYMEPVGPVSDDRYGYICMFKYLDWFDPTIDTASWKDQA